MNGDKDLTKFAAMTYAKAFVKRHSRVDDNTRRTQLFTEEEHPNQASSIFEEEEFVHD